jgi:hypothetical protein
MIYNGLRLICAREKRGNDAQRYEALREESKAAYEAFCAARDTHDREQLKKGQVSSSAFEMHFEGEVELYELAGRQILAGSALPESLWLDLAISCRGGGASALGRLLGPNDFDWPWYEHWRRVFIEEKKRLPDTIGVGGDIAWEIPSDVVHAPYIKTKDVMADMTVAELRQLANACDIKLAGKTKKEEIGQVLAPKIQWNEVAEWAAVRNKEHEDKVRLARIRGKQGLLSHSLFSRFNNLLRHGQIADLLIEPRLTKKYKPILEISANRWLVREFAKDWRFDPDNRENLPPFFPGDRTTLETKWK